MLVKYYNLARNDLFLAQASPNDTRPKKQLELKGLHPIVNFTRIEMGKFVPWT